MSRILVSELHPGHVSLVMSVGDSISAAFAARGTIFEDRDIAWSGGKGEANALTLPYLLNQYGVPVEGASTTMVIPNGLTHLPHGDYHRKTGIALLQTREKSHVWTQTHV